MLHYNNSQPQSTIVPLRKLPIIRTKFTSSEDQKLMNLVNIMGTNNWDQIASILKTRTSRQCRDRYYHYLSPDLNKKQFTPEEDVILEMKVIELGKCWKTLESFFPGRTEVSIRNRWNVLQRKRVKLIKKQISLMTAVKGKYSKKSKEIVSTNEESSSMESCDSESTEFEDSEPYLNVDWFDLADEFENSIQPEEEFMCEYMF
ncbi:Myb-like DNA-binding domain containing protein [Tritrichomonas foetus]|uniref:Myb-like DNA-binding domain containing protein n=1 Tax=Tritrichomonas foetus TaxID=1144522 RepID=A0A1J4JPP1_9EUKA|nr:Myb-like DNA-binding domain containing protein [Tritrichomonas foetus]|eukprot:OHT00376.1 Myb-like DNA-binding domain containing protein [Tritrichomonas foetus]